MWFSKCWVFPGVEFQPRLCSSSLLGYPGSQGQPLWEVEIGERYKTSPFSLLPESLEKLHFPDLFLIFLVLLDLCFEDEKSCIVCGGVSCLRSIILSLTGPFYIRLNMLGRAEMISVEIANNISCLQWSSIGFKVAPKAVLSSFSSIISVYFQRKLLRWVIIRWPCCKV